MKLKTIEELGLEWTVKYNIIEPKELIKGLALQNINFIQGHVTIGTIESYRINMELRLDRSKGKIITRYPKEDSLPSVTTRANHKEFLRLHENFLFKIDKIKFTNGEEFVGKFIE